VTGNLNLPANDIQFKLLGLNLADVGFELAPVGPTTGTIDLSNLTVSITSTFDIKIPHLNVLGTRLNLVGRLCQTTEPITLTMSGPVDLANPSHFSGEFTIPKFRTAACSPSPST
jgi:hypothetical protein